MSLSQSHSIIHQIITNNMICLNSKIIFKQVELYQYELSLSKNGFLRKLNCK